MSERMRPSLVAAQGLPADPASPSDWDRTRDRINERCPDLEGLSPETVDLVATMTLSWHDSVNGHTVELAGYRPSVDYVRKQLRGGPEHPITLEDVAWAAIKQPERLVALLRPLSVHLALEAPTEMAALLAELAPLVGCALEPQAAGIGDAMEASAALMDEAVAAGTALVRDARDGRVDEAEAHLARLQRVKAAVADAETSIRGKGKRS